jgi:hypothetical protein
VSGKHRFRVLKSDLPVAFGRMHVLPMLVDIIEERIDVAVRIGASDIWPPPPIRKRAPCSQWPVSGRSATAKIGDIVIAPAGPINAPKSISRLNYFNHLEIDRGHSLGADPGVFVKFTPFAGQCVQGKLYKRPMFSYIREHRPLMELWTGYEF